MIARQNDTVGSLKDLGRRGCLHLAADVFQRLLDAAKVAFTVVNERDHRLFILSIILDEWRLIMYNFVRAYL